MKIGGSGAADGRDIAIDASGLRVAVVVGRFNQQITQRLLAGAREYLQQHGVGDDDVNVIWVPGAWEVPQAVARVLAGGQADAVVALGCLIRGETDHYDVLASSVTGSLATLARSGGVPLAFGILTVRSLQQATDRAGGRVGNQGRDAARAAIEMADLFRRLA